MEEETKAPEKRNYRITIILKDEIIVERFETERIAISTIEKMKELFPKSFFGGAVEKKGKGWKVIWTLGNR